MLVLHQPWIKMNVLVGMYINIFLIYILYGFLVVKCDLGKSEGEPCEWEDINGVCVNERRCLTTLDERSPKQPICTTKGEDKIICCTDCEVVNDTRNAVLSPTGSLHWKTGQKAYDKCLEYLDLPYQCRMTFYSGLMREFNETRKCHEYSLWGAAGSAPPGTHQRRNQYPQSVLFGYGEDLGSATWSCGGTILSENYVLTSASCRSHNIANKTIPLKFVAFGQLDRAQPSNQWQHVTVKRVILHPEYQPPSEYNNIALVEIETPFTFNKNVLPACLHTVEPFDDEAKFTTWIDKDLNTADRLIAVSVTKTDKELCDTSFPTSDNLPRGFDDTTQLCYGDKEPKPFCRNFGGEPLLTRYHISSCFYTVIGVTSSENTCHEGNQVAAYTKVINYVPWIESIVWP